MERLRTKTLTLGGILAAAVLLLLYCAMTLPNMKLVLYGLSSLPILIMVIEGGRRSAAIFYGATALLAAILLPDKLAALPYILVLGSYGLVKSLAEAGNSFWREWVIKLLYFNLVMGIYYLLLVKLLLPELVLPLPLWVLILIAEVLFLLFDFVQSQAVIYYEQVLAPKVFPRRAEEGGEKHD